MRSFIKQAETLLINLYPKPEVDSLIFRLISDTMNINRAQFLLIKDIPLSNSVLEVLQSKLARLSLGEPLQYVLGEAEFCSLHFKVASGVLIPRPETEELTHLIISENHQSGLHVLDIGTGSGCIAISLAANLKNPTVQAWDISSQALAIAQQNAIRNSQAVQFIQRDILTDSIETKSKFDIIVSNPPYICKNEKAEIHQNVLLYEPHIALFVPNEDPLVFYRVIARQAVNSLHPNGKLYFEINQLFGKEVQQLLIDLGFKNVRLCKDIFRKDRIVCGEL